MKMTPRNRFGKDLDNYLLIQLVASMEYGSYSRSVYNVLDLFGTIGGILEIFMFIVELIMEPISEHAFFCSAISTFCIAKHSEEEKIFKSVDLKKKRKHSSV